MITLRSLVGMARPMLVVVVAGPIYLIGSLIATAFRYPWDNSGFMWGLAALVPSLLAAHYANEYADFETDSLTQRTPFSGGSGVLEQGLVTRQLALDAMQVMLVTGIGILSAGLILGRLGTIALLLWMIGTGVGVAYSLPPLQLAWRGWGEVINALLIGLVVPLYAFAVQTDHVDWRVLIGCLPFTLLIFDLILATNWADRLADTQVGKRTLVTWVPPRYLRMLYISAAIAGFGTQPLMIGTILPKLVAYSSLPGIPVMLWAATKFTRVRSPSPTVSALLVILPLQIAAWILTGLSGA